MFRQRLHVELSTPRGRIFSGTASSVDMKTGEGRIAITPWEKNYLSLMHTTEITLRIGHEFCRFVLTNATASLSEGHLAVLAEEIEPLALAAADTLDPEI